MLAAGLPAAAQVTPFPLTGWAKLPVPATDSYYLRYVPASLDASQPAPVVVFLHGSGGRPELYQSFVAEAAERAGCVLVMPRSSSTLGWGFGDDDETIRESLRLVRETLPVDPRRVAVAGHSAGGAYAYLLAYAGHPGLAEFSAVFTLAASRYTVTAVADPLYKAPIRMFYGTLDENYANGAYTGLKQQWERLGVPYEEDVRPGYAHRDLPADAMEQGFRFLVGKTYPAAAPDACVPGPTSHCLRGGRFRVEVAWRDFQGGTGAGRVVPGAADDSGLFWFFAPENWEMLVKVLDGCSLNGRFWVFAAATTTVEYDLTVTDTRTKEVARYHNPLGTAAPALTDTGALAVCP
jgi:acetyl esterase/lipase